MLKEMIFLGSYYCDIDGWDSSVMYPHDGKWRYQTSCLTCRELTNDEAKAIVAEYLRKLESYDKDAVSVLRSRYGKQWRRKRTEKISELKVDLCRFA